MNGTFVATGPKDSSRIETGAQAVNLASLFTKQEM
jgi:hypothetical protein